MRSFQEVKTWGEEVFRSRAIIGITGQQMLKVGMIEFW